MHITKAVITAAAPNRRTEPLQTLIDRDGKAKSVLCIVVEEALSAGIEELCIVVCPGDEIPYADAVGEHAGRITFIPQKSPRGYGYAVYCACEFVRDEPFLHMVGDHIFVGPGTMGWSRQVIETAVANECSVSAVQPTREMLLPYFGAVGGRRVPGSRDLCLIDRVLEKPSPTDAEQTLLVPGLRAGHYLCFFGLHVLTPTAMTLLEKAAEAKGERIELSPILNELAQGEKYLALEVKGRRYPVDVRYGLLAAQIGLALEGRDREEVLALICDLLAQRELFKGEHDAR